MSVTHRLKTHPEPFDAVACGRKTFEFRRDDRLPPFAIDDRLELAEWDPAANAGAGAFTGRELECGVSYVLRGAFGVPLGYAVLAIKVERGTSLSEAPRGWLERVLGLDDGEGLLAARTIDWAKGFDPALGLPAPGTLDSVRARRARALGGLVVECWGHAEAEDDLRRLWRLTCELVVLRAAPQLLEIEREPVVLFARELLRATPARRAP